MIFSLRGKITELTPMQAVVEVHGVGYGVHLSLQTSGKLAVGQEVYLHTQQLIREDAHPLFGFLQKEEKEIFNLLISVNGVGPASAMIMLSSLEIPEIATAIASGQSGVLQRVKGIGAKTAERIIIDLRDKMARFQTEEPGTSRVYSPAKEEALVALEVLGIPRRTAEKLADKILMAQPEASVEDLVKQILKTI